jgi:hypothetical protein
VTRAAAAAVIVALFGAGCGGHHHARTFPRTPGSAAATPAGAPVTRGEVAVIRGWSSALRRGRVVAAARYFAVPVTVLNGPSVVVLRTRRAVREFNRELPCGAELTRWQRAPRHFVIATFRLTNRVGSRCDGTPGALAAVAILVRKGHIVQWLRVPVPDQSGASSTA